MSALLKQKLKFAAGRMAGSAGLYALEFRRKMVIVAFHRVNDSMAADGLTCSSAKFDAFCQFFRARFRVLSLTDQVRACRAGEDLGGTLSITFDDGYSDNFEVAAPILRRHRLPATFFVTSGFVGSRAVASWDRHFDPPPYWMSWEQVRGLKAQGFEIGAHTVSHIDMGTEPPDRVRAELADCKRQLEHELGSAVTLFAYPFGGRSHITPEGRDLVRAAGFECCLSCHGGINAPIGCDPYALNRIGIAEWFATPEQFGLELLLGRV